SLKKEEILFSLDLSLSNPYISLQRSSLSFASCHLTHCILPPYIVYPATLHTTSCHLAKFLLDINKFSLDIISFFPRLNKK
ncbi:MAG: hypothetical protein PHV76_04955, partial [Bacteroidales bacterium]|nr:hypothetical protein [Bacteroidales bacterium]